MTRMPPSIALDQPKKRIARAFSRAATTYDRAATLQRKVGDTLLAKRPTSLSPEFVVDLGAGTGFYSQKLIQKYPGINLVSLDLAEGMLRYSKEKLHGESYHIQADIDFLPFKKESVDLFFSSLVLQWCSNFQGVIEQLQYSLKPGGSILFSTLVNGSLFELAEAWSEIDYCSHVNHYQSEDSLKQLLYNSGLNVLSLECQNTVLWYDSLRSLIKELKSLGASTVINAKAGCGSRQKLLALQKNYEAYRQEQGVPATYRVMYGHLTKPE